MKKTATKALGVVIAASAIAIGSTSVARAQERMIVNVPFDFIVGDGQLPAGDYVVTEASVGSGVLAIESADGREFAETLTIPAREDASAAEPELKFEKFSNHYFLAAVVSQEGPERDIVLTPALME